MFESYDKYLDQLDFEARWYNVNIEAQIEELEDELSEETNPQSRAKIEYKIAELKKELA